MSGRPYAEGTSVSVAGSRAEIEKLLARYGATSFAYGYDATRAVVQFAADGRQVRFVVPMPDPAQFHRSPAGRTRDAAAQAKAVDAEERRRWRALALAIKAKLEVVASGIATFEEEFAAHIVLPDGSTVGEWLTPQIAEAYESMTMPSLLPGVREIGAGR